MGKILLIFPFAFRPPKKKNKGSTRLNWINEETTTSLTPSHRSFRVTGDEQWSRDGDDKNMKGGTNAKINERQLVAKTDEQLTSLTMFTKLFLLPFYKRLHFGEVADGGPKIN